MVAIKTALGMAMTTMTFAMMVIVMMGAAAPIMNLCGGMMAIPVSMAVVRSMFIL